jgi:hypothetical protein
VDPTSVVGINAWNDRVKRKAAKTSNGFRNEKAEESLYVYGALL